MSTFDYSKFHRLSDPFSTQALRLTPCPSCVWLNEETAIGLATGTLKEASNELQMCGTSGQRPMSWLWSTFPPLRFVSEQTALLLTNNEVVGWSTYPVKITDREGRVLPGYRGFAVTGRAGEVRHDLSTNTTLHHPWGTSTRVHRGLYFDPQAWDESEFFLVGGHTVITERVRELFTKNRVSNVKLAPITEVEMPVYLSGMD